MKEKQVAIINGANLNLLGVRESDNYGHETWEQIEKRLRKLEPQLDINLKIYQSNHEGDIVDFIQENLDVLDGIVINPAGFTINGYTILDALTAKKTPFIEIHLSNIFERGGWHSKSIFSRYAVGFIAGLKGYSYDLGLYAIVYYLKKNSYMVASTLKKKIDRIE